MIPRDFKQVFNVNLKTVLIKLNYFGKCLIQW